MDLQLRHLVWSFVMSNSARLLTACLRNYMDRLVNSLPLPCGSHVMGLYSPQSIVIVNYYWAFEVVHKILFKLRLQPKLNCSLVSITIHCLFAYGREEKKFLYLFFFRFLVIVIDLHQDLCRQF